VPPIRYKGIKTHRSWFRNTELLADSFRGVLWNFSMPLHGGSPTIRWVLPDRMVASFAHESAAMLLQMPKQIPAFHDYAP